MNHYCANCHQPVERDTAGEWVHVEDGLSFCEGLNGEQAEVEE